MSVATGMPSGALGVIGRSLAITLVLLSAASLAACAGRHASPTDPATDGTARGPMSDASWALLPLEDGSADGDLGAAALRSAAVLLDTHLRARGVDRLESVPEGDPPRGDHRYTIGGVVDAWREGIRPGDASRVSMRVEVRDVTSGDVLWRNAVQRNGRVGQPLFASADRAVAALLRDLPLVPNGGEAAAAETVETADRADGLDGANRAADDEGEGLRAVDLLASGRASSPSPAPAVALGLRVAGEPSTLDSAAAAAFDGRSTAFFYGATPPSALLSQFDRVVLEADNVRTEELAAITASGATAFAYLSVGEAGAHRGWFASLDPAAVLGRNDAWGSAVMDLAADSWVEHLLTRADALAETGYGGLFLDTMDSFNLVAKTPAARKRQSDALVELVSRLATRRPGLRLIANRGFEVLERIAPHLEAIAAESLYAGWDNGAGRYTAVPHDDRAWLLDQLERARERFDLDVVAIDYVAPGEREKARAVATRIAAHGFVPWVATPAFDHVGVGAIDVLPREVLMLFDSRVNGAQAEAEVHRLLATPLEYLGYVPVYHDLATLGLPGNVLGGRFAGIVMWHRGGSLHPGLQDWFESRAASGTPIALFGTQWIPPGSALAERIGVDIAAPIDAGSARVRASDALIGFEKPLPPRLESLGRQGLSTASDNRVHLSLEDAQGARADLVVTGPWGGLAAHPGVVEIDVDEVTHWILDPYAFLKRALALPDAPMPDVTTERGKRLWMAHIDGDALPSWAELPGRRLGAEVIRGRILDRYPLPHTISVVEAEMTEMFAHADRRTRMFELMREIFARPTVEIASHTFSHPFLWERLAEEGRSGRFNLPVAGYRYDPVREVAGSAAFIDRELAPAGKRTRVMLWSGDALPDEAALAAADEAGLANLNGGFTTISRATPVLSLVTPMARTVGERVQVYAPIMNENVYTNDWTGPFDGFRRVIETLELTDRPRRLKPLSIYYHFYAGTKAASVRSLEEVYDWSLTQDIHPTTVGAYAARATAYRKVGVARRLDGSWQLSALAPIRSVRVLGEGHRVERSASAHVTASHRLHDGLYVDTDGAARVTIGLGPAHLIGSGETAGGSSGE